jgi:predicted DNA binding CopG/RHH family protein
MEEPMEKQNVRSQREIDTLVANQVLDAEEQEIEDALVSGKINLPTPEQVKRRLQKLKSQIGKPVPKVPVTLRMEKLTLLVLKDQAQTQGLRYQSLIGSILHKYITGKLVERK